jgi:hypothetical protein
MSNCISEKNLQPFLSLPFLRVAKKGLRVGHAVILNGCGWLTHHDTSVE